MTDGAHGVTEALALAYALGVALYTSAYFALYVAGVSTGAAAAPALGVMLVGLAAGACGLRLARRGETYRAGEGGGTPLIVLMGLAAALVQVWIAAGTAVRSQLRFWDAWFVWAVKARMFLADGPPPGYFKGALGPVAHPDYPLNAPLAEAAFFRLPAPLGTPLASLVGTFSLAALLALFYVGTARLYGRDRAAMATGLLALVPVLTRWAALGYTDPMLALYGGTSLLYLALWWRERQPADLVLMGLMAGGAIWTKKEGTVIAALVLLAAALGEVRRDDAPRRRLSAILIGVLATVAVPLPWLIFTRATRPLATDFWPFTPSVFMAHAERLPNILALFGQEMLTLNHWSLFWIALVAVLVLTGLHRLSGQGWALLLLLCAQLAIYVVSFVFSYWVPYTAHIATSADRLLLHTLPWAALLMLEATESLLPAHAHMRVAPMAHLPATGDRAVAR